MRIFNGAPLALTPVAAPHGLTVWAAPTGRVLTFDADGHPHEEFLVFLDGRVQGPNELVSPATDGSTRLADGDYGTQPPGSSDFILRQEECERLREAVAWVRALSSKVFS